MLSDVLSLVTEVPRSPPDWRRLGEHLPFEWIEDALAYKGKASIRVRRLPAQQVVWLVIGLALYRHLSIKEVLDDLDLALPELKERCATASAACQARQRLGAEPLHWLFQTAAKAWHQDSNSSQFHGMDLLAMDGTTLRLADSAANREHFGAQRYADSKMASFPQVRGVTLMAVPTHLILDARFTQYKIGEMVSAKELLSSIPDNSLTVFDRGFLAADLLCTLRSHGVNRHYLVPAKSNTKWKRIDGTEADGTVEMEVSGAALRANPDLPATWQARAIRVDDGNQEIWGALSAYNLVRVEIAKAAHEAKCQPTEISFTLAFRTIQYELFIAAATQAYGKLPALLIRLRQRLVLDLKEFRPDRKFDRVVKAKPQRYPHKKLKTSP